ncbi:hypothetical protein ACQQ9V_10550 [Hornefia butyriciproducens]|uniref:oxidoreductase n=1 Tax=Hornefia butyriciproducens TaxID=2652293 RepID=UPI002A912A46|nr:2,4-dienoyl-CoA reductase [Hornefia butyriciproducens]MDY5462159.1 2,4-dienoyl-CoA reductase [Hornefia butyriciproducens]
MGKFSNLEKSLKIGELTSRNRFCVQPMECCDAEADGNVSARALKRYARYCDGGAGVVVIESVTLQYASRSTRRQLLLNIHDPVNRRGWEDFFRTLKILHPGAVLIMQLNHAGEYSSDEWSERVCVKPKEGFGGRQIDAEYVDGVIRDYIEAAEFLYRIGCDGVDLKFCHGYLGSQILRPYNDRKWKYGGSWENRSRFAFDMCGEIRHRIPDHRFLVGAKVSVVEGIWQGQGNRGNEIDVTESVALCRGLEDRGADFIIESLGAARERWDLMAPNHDCPEHVWLHVTAAQVIRNALKPETAVICGGLSALGRDYGEITDFCIGDGMFDMAAIGRQVLADPDFPAKILGGKAEEINYCRCCDACGELLIRQKPTWCVYGRL